MHQCPIKHALLQPHSTGSTYSIALFLLLCLYLPLAHAQKEIIYNVTGRPPLNTIEENGFMDEVSREALSRIGYQLIIHHLPPERGLRSLDKGLIDAEMSRVKELNTLYPALIRVREKIMDWDFIVFSNKNIDLSKGWNSLAGENIAYMTGWKILDKNIPKTAIVTKANTPQQLFNLLLKKRVDCIIYEYWGGKHLIKKLSLKEIKPQFPALAKKEMFTYLNKKHSNLAIQLSASLKQMKQDGSYQKLLEKHLTPYTEKQ